MPDWRSLLESAASRAQLACESVRDGGERDTRVGVGAAGDETLVADREAERAIIETLQSVGRIRVLSEEAGEVGPSSSKLLAIIDPLDGSSNYSRGIPFYCTSICLVEGRGLSEARYALVRNLVTGASYYAEKGAGAFKNGKRLRSSGETKLSESIAAVDLSKASPETIAMLGPLTARVSRQVHYGANALELCMVADGEVDSFVDLRNKMRITDLAGAYLVVKEAGALITSETGEELHPQLNLRSRMSMVAAANPVLHRQILEVLGVLRGRKP